MQTLIRGAFLGVVLLASSQAILASDAPAQRPVPVAVGAAPTLGLPLVVAQYSDNSSSSSGSSRVRIPRGVGKLVVFVVVALFGAAGWVVKKMTAG